MNTFIYATAGVTAFLVACTAACWLILWREEREQEKFELDTFNIEVAQLIESERKRHAND